jgi:hypothetical protein
VAASPRGAGARAGRVAARRGDGGRDGPAGPGELPAARRRGDRARLPVPARGRGGLPLPRLLPPDPRGPRRDTGGASRSSARRLLEPRREPGARSRLVAPDVRAAGLGRRLPRRPLRPGRPGEPRGLRPARHPPRAADASPLRGPRCGRPPLPARRPALRGAHRRLRPRPRGSLPPQPRCLAGGRARGPGADGVRRSFGRHLGPPGSRGRPRAEGPARERRPELHGQRVARGPHPRHLAVLVAIYPA